MRCQHCGSKDFTNIQGRRYCLHCGYAVKAPAAVGQTQAAPVTRQAVRSKTKIARQRVQVAPPRSPWLYPAAAAPGPHTQAVVKSQVSSNWPAKAHPATFTAHIAAALGLGIGIITTLALWLSLDSDISLYLIVGGVIVVLVGMILAQSALLYGVSRFDDGRQLPRRVWWGVARNAFMDVLNANMIAWTTMVAAMVIGIAVWQFDAGLQGSWAVVRAIIVILVNGGLCWLIIGVYASRRVAVAAAVIGGVTAGEAYRVGWRLYMRRGGSLVVVATKALAGRLVTVAAIVGLVYLATNHLHAGSGSVLRIAIACGLMVAAGVFLLLTVLLEWETRLWLGFYRQAVTAFSPAERVRLLTGRPAVQP